MALTSNRDLDHYIDQELRSFQVASSVYVYKGSFVGLNSTGYVRPLLSGDAFVGIAYEEKNNNTGSEGDQSVRVYTLGDFGHTLTGATVGDIGRPVFASEEDTLTFNGAGNSYVGIVQDRIASNEIILRIDSGRRLVKSITHAVEDLAAGADISARAIHAFEKEGWIISVRVVNQATAATGIDGSNTCMITLANNAGTVVTETFDGATTFPSVNTAQNLGNLANTQVTSSDVLTLTVTNGVTADPGPFIVEVDYV